MALINNTLSYDDGTASNEAFKKPFRVAVQNKFLRTPEIIKWMGTPTTGNRALDRRLQENFVEIMATPMACVEYYLLGAPIKFSNAAIPAKILNILRQHLRNWDWIISNLYNVEPPPFEELDDISEFCSCIVKYAGAANKNRDGTLLLNGRMHRIARNEGISMPDIGSRRRKIPTAETTSDSGDLKTGTELRNEKLMNFRKSFSTQKSGG